MSVVEFGSHFLACMRLEFANIEAEGPTIVFSMENPASPSPPSVDVGVV